jgi:glycosyltransferase involved in cell wall biosynthesis
MSRTSVVSIVMIFLNGEKFIEEAIESAIAQTYPHWELLLIDDGSTDTSTEIARRYVEKDPDRIRYLEHEGHRNRGMSASRNLGIANATGHYISFLDADDLWTFSKLEQQVAILDARPDTAFVCAPALWWYGWTGKSEDRQRDFIQRFEIELNRVIQPPTLLLLFLQDEWASLCDILVRREAVKAIGGYESFFRGMYEDQAFHAKLCLHSSVYVSSECWYWYRQHPEACTTTAHKVKRGHAIARKTFLYWLEKYLSQQGCQHYELWQVLRKELWPYRHPILFRISNRVQAVLN